MNKKKHELESMSPATKLLEKRRQMYDKQKDYEDDKEKFKKAEENFKTQEAELIKKDIDLQNQLIGFSKILQDNQAKKEKATKKIKTEQALIKAKDEELKRKKEELERLKRQTDNISVKVQSMKAYEQFLEQVKEKNPDEYNELSDIRSRYETLNNSYKKLDRRLKEIHGEYEALKTSKNQFFTSTDIEIMSLNNMITTKQGEKERMDDEQNKMKGRQEEETAKQLKKTSEIGLILMAIDNLYNKCLNSKSHLKWRIPGDSSNAKTKSFKERTDIAVSQLEVVSEYYEDFDEVINELKYKR